MSTTQEICAWMMVFTRRVDRTDTVFTAGDFIRKNPSCYHATEVLGPYDLVVSVTGKTLENIYQYQRDLQELDVVGNIATYPVIKSFARTHGGFSPTGYILIETCSGEAELVWRRLKDVADILRRDVVMGLFDIIVVTNIPIIQLSSLLSSIRKINGVLRTVTLWGLNRPVA